MILKDLHVHSTFSDGKFSPEEIILEAIRRKMTTIGISDHAFTSFDDDFCMREEVIEDYKKTVLELKEKYQDQIEVLFGIEQDFDSDYFPEGFDYVIGSCHYTTKDDLKISVDWSREKQIGYVRDYYDNDYYAFCENYYEKMAKMIEKTSCNIIGHFDLISIFNEENDLFDVQHERYRSAWKKALEKLLKEDVKFEINTGAVARGYRTFPYPSQEIIDYIKANDSIYKNGKGRFILSSDAHRIENLMYGFEKYEELL